MSNAAESNKRIVSYDIIRIFAVLAVVMIHASSGFVADFPARSANFVFGNILDSISRVGVPLFVMLSGALMLNENKDIPPKRMFKYVLNIIVLIFSWSLLYSVISQILYPLLTKKPISFTEFWDCFIFSKYDYLWYLFMLIGLYLITPILRSFVKKANAKVVLYFIILSLVFSFSVPLCNFLVNSITETVDFVQTYADKFYMGFVGQFTAYYLLGWYITNIEIKRKHRFILYGVGFMGLLVTILGTQLFINDTNEIYKLFYSNTSINILCYSTAVFVFLFYCFKNKKYSEKSIKRITTLSKLTFGVYIMHPMVMIIENIFINIEIAFIRIPLNWLVAVSVSFIAAYILSKIPVLKKLVKF